MIAGVGVLLLAMGVGVLIGRSGDSKQSAAPAAGDQRQLGAVGGHRHHGVAPKRRFTGDWPSGTTGYTVQLQTLPQSGTAVSAVEAAKSAASAKGAKAVGALKSEEFSSLTAGSYVIYSGVYHTKAEAEKAPGRPEEELPGRQGDQGVQRRRRAPPAEGSRLVLGRGPARATATRPRPPCSTASKGPKARATRKNPRTCPTWSKPG